MSVKSNKAVQNNTNPANFATPAHHPHAMRSSQQTIENGTPWGNNSGNGWGYDPATVTARDESIGENVRATTIKVLNLCKSDIVGVANLAFIGPVHGHNPMAIILRALGRMVQYPNPQGFNLGTINIGAFSSYSLGRALTLVGYIGETCETNIARKVIEIISEELTNNLTEDILNKLHLELTEFNAVLADLGGLGH